MPETPNPQRRVRVDATYAREFAGKVHSSSKPVLFREYSSRTEANSRCWEWNRSRPVFFGLGVEFIVKELDASDRSAGFGVYGRPAARAHNLIVASEKDGPLLRLIPKGSRG